MLIYLTKCNKYTVLPRACRISLFHLFRAPPPVHVLACKLSHRGSEHPHILIKVAVLSLEIRGCIFKLSITPRLSGLREGEPVIQIRRCNLLRMANTPHCTLASVSCTMKKFMTQREIYIHGPTLKNFCK